MTKYEEKARILVLDDEEDICLMIRDILESEKFEVKFTTNIEEANKILQTFSPAAIISDIWLKEQDDGLQFLKNIKSLYKYLPVIMISGHGNIKIAIEAIKLGAFDYIEKPFSSTKLKVVVKNAVENYFLKKQILEADILSERYNKIIGSSKIINNIRKVAEFAARGPSRAIIIGPTGSGKEQIARFIHKNCALHEMSFNVITPLHPITLNLENFSSLSAFEGTIFLEDLSEFSFGFQEHLYRFLSEPKFFDSQEDQPKLRVIASKNSDRLGLLAPNLINRLSIVSIEMPPLNQRLEDIPELCEFFCLYFHENSKLPKATFTDEAILMLQTAEWPGNVRQLKSSVEWILRNIPRTNASHTIISKEMLLPSFFSSTKNGLDGEALSKSLKDAREEFEKNYLSMHLKRCGGSVSKTAEAVDMDRSSLHRKLKSLNLVD